MKKIIVVTVLLLANAFTLNAKSENSLSYTAGYASQYIFRGIDYNKLRPAPYGSIDYSFDNKFYAGVWTSAYTGGDGATKEVDYYFGYTPTFGNFSLDIGHTTFLYPGSDTSGVSSGEFGLKLSFAPEKKPYSVQTNFFQGDQGTKTETQEFILNYGFKNFDTSFTYGDVENSNKYKSFSISKNISNFDIKISYIDNEMDTSGSVNTREFLTLDISKTF